MATAEKIEEKVDEKRIAIYEAFKKNVNKGDDDATKIAMITAGATFSNVSRMFSEFMVETGMMASKEEKEKFLESLKDVNLEDENIFKKAVSDCSKKLKGIDEGDASKIIRYWAKKNEKPVYKKAGGPGRTSGFRFKLYDAMRANPMMTNDECTKLVNEQGSDNDKKHLTHYIGIMNLVRDIASKKKAA